jgi:hypothetical protein
LLGWLDVLHLNVPGDCIEVHYCGRRITLVALGLGDLALSRVWCTSVRQWPSERKPASADVKPAATTGIRPGSELRETLPDDIASSARATLVPLNRGRRWSLLYRAPAQSHLLHDYRPAA